jgi:FAD binding domain
VTVAGTAVLRSALNTDRTSSEMTTNQGAAEGMRRELQSGFAGELIAPQDADYDEARKVYNAMIDRRPALIARCAGGQDVARAIAFARAHDLPLAVRGGGHNGAGPGICDDGVVADLSLLREITVNPRTRTARVGGGCTRGQVDRATHAHGVATPSGFISTTGVGGGKLRRCDFVPVRFASGEHGPARPAVPRGALLPQGLRHRVVLPRSRRASARRPRADARSGEAAPARRRPDALPHFQSMFDALYRPGLQWYWRADFVLELPDETVDRHATFAERLPTMHMYPIDGAAHDVGPPDTAFSYRDAN